MKRLARFAAVVVASLAPSFATMAETVRVQSGEHGTFSRLALVMGEPTDWDLGRMDTGFGLRLTRENITLDLQRAFDLIPRTRIQDLRWNNAEGVLEITADCDCHVTGFILGNSILVVDVVDGPVPQGTRFDTALFGSETTTSAPAATTPVLKLESKRTVTDPDSALPPLLQKTMRNRYDRQVEIDRPARLTKPKMQRPDTTAQTTFAESTARQRVSEIEAELLKQLSRAGAQGMIQPSAEFSGTSGPTLQPDASTLPNPHPGANVDAVTGVDRATPPDIRSGTVETTRCHPSGFFEFLVIEPKTDPHEMIATARQSLLREFDAPNTKAAEDLVRAYLYLGFGAEARQVVDRFLTGTPQADLYRSIANVMDDTPNAETGALAGQSSCPGQVAFWALLAQPIPETLSLNARDSVRATASDLPLHLRRWLVPRLAQKLLACGHDDLAAALRDALRRAEGDHGISYTLLQAKLAEVGDYAAGGDGHPSKASRLAAEGLLEEVADTNDAEAPQALLDLIRLETVRGVVPPPDRINHAEALIFEHDDTRLTRNFHIALAPAYALDGQFQKAFAHLDQALAMTPPADLDDPLPNARNSVGITLTSDASDAGFLRILFDPERSQIGREVSDETAHSIAARLLALGFPEQALAQAEHLPPEDAYRFTRIKAMMGLGRYERALASLSGLQGAESDRLRAEILAALGENERAHVLGQVAGDEDIARRAAWASGNPQLIAESGSAGEAGFAVNVAAEEPPVAPPTPSLGGTVDLLEKIRTRRAALEALLAEKSKETGEVGPNEAMPQKPGTFAPDS